MLTYMLDTNIAIYVIKRRPIEVLDKFNLNSTRLCVSSITAAELYYGAEKSQFPERNMAVIEDFLSRLTILDYTHKAATHFGNIKAHLSKQGKIIGENDIHIAAHARSEGLVLVTNNLREFERVEGLRLDNWV
ncbi:type II toxin-antitoxin system tRNA(fMet)-specific endonuclease VapC [Actinobacillus pleuropneumoniae]|uniref:type II toxin-antitoxin system tRNA(fMet)-specific endonuclease VapC n=1 Tax=Actinobacillus pleuropneumoniae TaxID=715 RepID=UPI001C020292|nr:tRNA(fMet)-specific endonuclease VapC [Actinobacillus pleuropneumoniae]MBT9319327.1 tRNA(fMet)-specific endonuclease VapC [Actinobacillus pleuropneumoniae]MBT9344242.1 tRNA(fMet)-specific endonuclease VapC [Actinobacillus pleuropneumoniae]UKH17204.1 tRNA(fMet)-specific endonuclease VapC [Actinobacillus pleuropneumoniae]